MAKRFYENQIYQCGQNQARVKPMNDPFDLFVNINLTGLESEHTLYLNGKKYKNNIKTKRGYWWHVNVITTKERDPQLVEMTSLQINYYNDTINKDLRVIFKAV